MLVNSDFVGLELFSTEQNPGGLSERMGKTSPILTYGGLVRGIELDHSGRDRLLARSPGDA